MRSSNIFISVKWAEYLLKSICIRMLHQIIFVPLTRIEIGKKTVSFLEPWLGNPEQFLVRGHQNLKYSTGGSCSKPDQFVFLAGTSLSSL